MASAHHVHGDAAPAMKTKTAKAKGGCGCKGGGSGGGPCGCLGEATRVDSCCDLVSFTRPNYFCGHLLTDADLSLGQRYLVEKNKLRNRALHGHGVVCGLRLVCDPVCPGHVRIEEGYAIDDCGNDLVLASTASFDVVGLLKEKGWILEALPPDPCAPPDEETECAPRQCFYVTACYDETPGAFTTPFTTTCSPPVKNCEPTRIHEGVRFDVLAEPPPPTGWKAVFDRLEKRFEECAALFETGPFAQALQQNAGDLVQAVNGGATPAQHKKWWDLFCQLRGFFLLYLKKHPDQFRCTLEEEVRQIPFPTEQEPAGSYGGLVREAYCRLLELAYGHVIDCILGATVFACCEPPEASCVVLGTVEVEAGRVVRVCNCPRTYVWSFAKLLEVLVATFVGGLACETKAEAQVIPGSTEAPLDDAGAVLGHGRGHGREKPQVCCRDLDLDCAAFVRNLQANPKAAFKNSAAFFKAFSTVAQSAGYAFDFTRQDVAPTQLLQWLPLAKAQAVAKQRQMLVEFREVEAVPEVPDLVAAVAQSRLVTEGAPMVAYHSGGVVVATHPVALTATRTAAVTRPGGGVEVDASSLEEMNAALKRKDAEIAEVRKAMADLEGRVKKLADRLPDDEGGGGRRGKGGRS